MAMARVDAVIFDMDGLLVNSEPVWHVVEKQVFGSLNVQLTDADCLETTGLRIDEVVKHWADRRSWDQSVSVDQVAQMIIHGMVENLKTNPVAMPGVENALQFFESKNIPLAVASSSPEPLIWAALDGLGIRERFQVVCSATKEQFGKPHPAVYLKAAELCGADPRFCIALEDSFYGVIAAKAARMKCIAVPDRALVGSDISRFQCADVILKSLLEVDDATWLKLTSR